MNEKSVNILETFCIKCKLHTMEFKDPALSSPNQPTQPHTSFYYVWYQLYCETSRSIQFLSLGMDGYLGIQPTYWALGCLSQPILHIFLPPTPTEIPHGLFSPSVTTPVLACYLFSTQILSVSKTSSFKPQNSHSTKSCFPGNQI